MNAQNESAGGNEDYEELNESMLRGKSKTNLAKTGGFTPANEQPIDRGFRRSQVNMSSGNKKQSSAARTSNRDQFQNANASVFESIGSQADAGAVKSQRQSQRNEAGQRGGSQRQITMLQKHGQIMMPSLVKKHNK